MEVPKTKDCRTDILLLLPFILLSLSTHSVTPLSESLFHSETSRLHTKSPSSWWPYSCSSSKAGTLKHLGLPLCILLGPIIKLWPQKFESHSQSTGMLEKRLSLKILLNLSIPTRTHSPPSSHPSTLEGAPLYGPLPGFMELQRRLL